MFPLATTLLCTLAISAGQPIGLPHWATMKARSTPPPSLMGFLTKDLEAGSHFRKVGFTSAATEFVHLDFEFSLGTLERDASFLADSLAASKFATTGYSPLGHQVSALQDRIATLRALVAKQPTNLGKRQKRFIVTGLILAFGVAAISLGASIYTACLLYTSPSPRDLSTSRMPSSA